MKVTEAIEKNEGTNGNCHIKGQSNEVGCFQFLPSTWQGDSKKYLGYVAPATSYITQKYVTVYKVQAWIDQGKSDYEIGLLFNGGEVKAKKGRNKWGIAYDSGAYAKKLVVNIAEASN